MGMFNKAKPIDAPKTGKAKKDKIEVPMAQLQQLAEVIALIQTLDATAKTLSAEIKDAGFEKFIALETTTRPDSFRGVDGMASASVEMRKRGTNSPLNEDEVKVLEAQKITPFKQVMVNALFAINPKYAEDANLLAKVEKALVKIVPEDFIVQQEEVSKLVVTDEMLDAAFKTRNRAAIEICTTMALKPKLNEEYPMASLFDNVKEIVQPTKKPTAAKKVA